MTYATAILTVRHQDGCGIWRKCLFSVVVVVEAREVLSVDLCVVATLECQLFAVEVVRNFDPQCLFYTSQFCAIHHRHCTTLMMKMFTDIL